MTRSENWTQDGRQKEVENQVRGAHGLIKRHRVQSNTVRRRILVLPKGKRNFFVDQRITKRSKKILNRSQYDVSGKDLSRKGRPWNVKAV